MERITIKKGLDIPVSGAPDQTVAALKNVTQVAVLGEDYIGLKPKFSVAVGDTVAKGQVLFIDKKMPRIRHTAPAAGRIAAINRGEKRKFLSIIIDLEGDEEISFTSHPADTISKLSRETVADQLIESGLWTAIRSRPFGKVADPAAQPSSIFITAMDTNPLAPDMGVVLRGKEKEFQAGTDALAVLTEGKLHICTSPDYRIPAVSHPRAVVTEFAGKHPAGNVGTHIHFIDPVHTEKQVWYISAQDLCAVGELFITGALNSERIVSLAGPAVKKPRLQKVLLGSSVLDMTAGELQEGENRIVSGSLLSGRTAAGPEAFIGRYHQQVSVLPEFSKSGFFSWLSLGKDKFSVKNIFLSRLAFGRKLNFSTAANGGLRAIVPIESYEKVMPLDTVPTYLLRSLAVDDVEEAMNLGCLEMEEEDLALCTFVCPSKIDHGANLRRNLTIIEKEG